MLDDVGLADDDFADLSSELLAHRLEAIDESADFVAVELSGRCIGHCVCLLVMFGYLNSVSCLRCA